MSQTHFGPQPVFSSCMHRNIRVVYKGSRIFYGGDVVEDIEEKVVCLDCRQYLYETEVRAGWDGYRAIYLENEDEIK